MTLPAKSAIIEPKFTVNFVCVCRMAKRAGIYFSLLLLFFSVALFFVLLCICEVNKKNKLSAVVFHFYFASPSHIS